MNTTTHSTDGPRLPYTIFDTALELGAHVAQQVAEVIRAKAREGKYCVLCLPTGSSPLPMYHQLIQLHRKDRTLFDNVVIFNWDEYWPFSPHDARSYRHFMITNFLDPIGFDMSRFFIPDGDCPEGGLEAHCNWLESRIAAAGGFDLVIGGIGQNGHLGFNEPGSPMNSRTRRVDLAEVTRLGAAADFFGLDRVPRQAITLGLATCLGAAKFFVLITSETKARVAYRLIEGVDDPVGFPATCLYRHRGVHIFLDRPAASELTCQRAPWRSNSNVDWHLPRNIVRVAHCLLDEQDVPLDKIELNEPGLDALRKLYTPNSFCSAVRSHFQDTLRGMNGSGILANGKKPRVLALAPHPDDIEIQMGATIHRLVREGCHVYAAAMTSGNIAVWDHIAQEWASLLSNVRDAFNLDGEEDAHPIRARILSHLAKKKTDPLLLDTDEVLRLKGWIREREMVAGLSHLGISAADIRFLKLPFYETGGIGKRPLSTEDVDAVAKYLRQVKPDFVFAAGDLTDPHGTHRVCLDCLSRARELVFGESWFASCEWWLYRGAWQEWRPEEIHFAVPFTPEILQRKLDAVRQHASQVPKAMFPGVDPRPFPKRARDRNEATAHLFRSLGVLDENYVGVEAFRRWDSSLPV